MPLDGHAYLVSQGWEGKGNGLRRGAINRPVIVAQKKTLAGIGKDRDEAFPFWDHVFSAAASAIKVKVYNDSDSEDTDDSTPAVTFQRTSTGIISNRRPVSGTPASHSGTATPSSSGTSDSSRTRLSIMAAAKQEAARRTLYSMFFRGPVLGTDIVEEMAKVTVDETETLKADVVKVETKAGVVAIEEGRRRKLSVDDEKDVASQKRASKSKKSNSKGKEVATGRDEADAEATLEISGARAKLKSEKRDKKRKRDEEEEDSNGAKLDKAERKRSKAEKRARKEEKRKMKEAEAAAVREVEEMSAELRSVSPLVEAETSTRKRKKKDGKEKSKKKRQSESS